MFILLTFKKKKEEEENQAYASIRSEKVDKTV